MTGPNQSPTGYNLHVAAANVSDTASQLTPSDGPFRSVTWIDIEDRTLITNGIAIRDEQGQTLEIPVVLKVNLKPPL